LTEGEYSIAVYRFTLGLQLHHTFKANRHIWYFYSGLGTAVYDITWRTAGYDFDIKFPEPEATIFSDRTGYPDLTFATGFVIRIKPWLGLDLGTSVDMILDHATDVVASLRPGYIFPRIKTSGVIFDFKAGLVVLF